MTNQRPAEALRQLTDFLQTLKVHNTDLDACFNDAVAVSHLEKLVTAYAATVEREARQDELERLQATFGDRGILTFADTDYEEEAEIVVTAHFLNKISDRLAALQGPEDQTDDGIDYGGGSRG